MNEAEKNKLCEKSLNSQSNFNSGNSGENKGLHGAKNKQCKCNVCGVEVYRRTNLIDQMRTHTGERPFKCKISGCGVAFKLESNLKTHVKLKHSDARPFKCDFPGCRQSTKILQLLKKHKKIHSDKQFACPHSGCEFRARRKDGLSEHTLNVHSERKRWTCSMCRYSTNIARHLARHTVIHEGRNKKIPCSIEGCEYKGTSRKSFRLRMLHHGTLIRCPLSGCGRYARAKKAIENHVKLHNPSGRPFQCPLCSKYFLTLIQLQKHCVTHTNDKPFQCGHCEFAAATKTVVKRHISLVHTSLGFPVVIHLLDDRECLRCKVTLPTAEFSVHCKFHVDPAVMTA